MRKPNDRARPSSTPFASMSHMMDPMSLMQKAWTSMTAASPFGQRMVQPFTPTLDPEALDRQIADLRTVEQWLQLNLSILRNTIHGLEIQRGTLEVVRNFSDTVSKNLGNLGRDTDQAMAQAFAKFAESKAAATTATTNPYEELFARASRVERASDADGSTARRATAGPGRSAAVGAAGPDASASNASNAARPDSTRAGARSASEAAMHRAHRPSSSDLDDERATERPEAPPMPEGMNPAFWWNMLQSSFDNIARSAMREAEASSATRKPVEDDRSGAQVDDRADARTDARGKPDEAPAGSRASGTKTRQAAAQRSGTARTSTPDTNPARAGTARSSRMSPDAQDDGPAHDASSASAPVPTGQTTAPRAPSTSTSPPPSRSPSRSRGAVARKR